MSRHDQKRQVEATSKQVHYIRYLGRKVQGESCKYISQIQCLGFKRGHRITKEEAAAAIDLLKALIADKPSSTTYEPIRGTTMLDRIDELELAGLRSGHDQYSKLTLPALIELRPKEATQIAEQLPLAAEQRSAMRWVIRGLDVERAVAKVVVDRQTVKTVRDKRRLQKEQ